MTHKAAAPTISVWFISGEKVLELSPEFPCVAVWKLKEEIANVTGVTPAQQKLLRGARVLEENEILERDGGGAPNSEGGLDVQLVIAPARGNERSSTPTRMHVGWNGYTIDGDIEGRSTGGSGGDDGAEGLESALECLGCECLDGVWHLKESSHPVQPGWQTLRIKDGEVILGNGRSTFVTRLGSGEFMLSGAILEFDGLTVHRYADEGYQCFEYAGSPVCSSKMVHQSSLPGQPEFTSLLYPLD